MKMGVVQNIYNRNNVDKRKRIFCATILNTLYIANNFSYFVIILEEIQCDVNIR
jgi:hypothetical protein